VVAAVSSGPWGAVVAVGGLVVLVGVAVGLQQAGVDVRAPVLVPLLVIAAGAIVAWSNLDEAARDDWLGGGERGRGHGWIRVGLGLGLVVVGILVLALRRQPLNEVWDAFLATVAVLGGAVIVAAPWVVRLWRDMRREQVAAARATERADIAAHLHDSVLQTLTLIQRRAADPVAVAQLARAQERELRSWLYAPRQAGEQTLAAAAAAAAHEVEDLHGVPIEIVVTGDRELEPHGAALVRALREALLNAVRHGAPPVTAYVEIGPDGVEAFVRDRGGGFDLDAVPADRLGVRQSVLARMERHGGSARVRRREDGTEVELRLPRASLAAAPAPPAAAVPPADAVPPAAAVPPAGATGTTRTTWTPTTEEADHAHG
jgi:signal transduction histidine kinase